MKIFLDTCNLEEIRNGVSLGLVDGVTTNPSLIAKEKRDYRETLAQICEMVQGAVSAEVLSTDTEGMLREGRELAKIHSNIVIKIPLIAAGMPAVKTLHKEGIRTNVTLCFSAPQALLAAKTGATYISPFVGRLDDRGHRGMEVVEQIRAIYDNYGYETEILAASIRHPGHVVEAALAGADVCTLPYSVFQAIIRHPLTDEGLQKFLDDYKKAFGKS